MLCLMIPAKVSSHGNFILSAGIPYFLIPSKHLDISSSFHFILIHITNALCGSVVRFRISKSCQNHLELHQWLSNYVLLTVRTEKSLKT